MGLFKRCAHAGRNRDRCDHGWWGAFQHNGHLYRVSLSKWANEEITPLIRLFREDNKRRRSISEDEESTLLNAAPA